MKRFALLIAGAGALAIAAPVQAAAPTDPQIAHIAYTAGNIDIAAAKQALKVSKNADGSRLRAADGARPPGRERESARAGEEAARDAGSQSDEHCADARRPMPSVPSFTN